MSAGPASATPAYPGPLAALWLSFAAWMAAAAFIVMLRTGDADAPLGIAEIGIGEAIGLGLIASLAARRVPAPQSERLGLRGFASRFALPLCLLLPLSVWASEFVNVAHALFPPPDLQVALERSAERLDTGSLLAGLETCIVVVGLAPVVEEWLYRGVIQQGLVAHLGRWRGVLATACLFGVAHFEPSLSVATSLATFCATLPMGFVLGAVRLATGSLLAPILLHAGYNAVALGGLALADRLPIAGFNAPGAHTSAALLAICAIPVAWALAVVMRDARSARLLPPSPDEEARDPGPT